MTYAVLLRPIVVLAAALATLTSAASAEKPWGWAIHVLNRDDVATLHPIVQTLLERAPVGARHPWESPSGKTGFVYLDAGGDQAGSRDAVIRVTRIAKGRETRLYVFRYKKDPAKGWATIG